MTTLIVSDPVFLEHEVPRGHPERPDRIRAVNAVLGEERFAALPRKAPRPVDDATLMLAHPEDYIATIRAALPADGEVALDADTWLSPRSFEVASDAVGSACLAVDAVMTGEADNAFCATRPPGHHAEARVAMGFCLFANAVIGARHAQQAHGVERVAIVDWDVHHGNGTQALVWSDPSILYASTHQMPLFPGTGAASETGAGNVVNAPLPPGADGVAFMDAFTGHLLPAINAFSPDLIIVSAGFDAHWRDPLASLNLTEQDFAWATEAMTTVAARHCDGRIVSLLEGGYDLQGLADSVAAHIEALKRT
ncbi:histone deacetylase family protein [Bauldia sp.]|uniref:histone deacetylase family protein n=1 Tax=Bauldia sp. TaxID=2575872 RepID=UPI003BA967D7